MSSQRISNYIYEDVLIQILKNLPARNLVRFRSVCKSWKGIIDSDELMLKHLALQNPSFFVDYGATEFVAVEIGDNCKPSTRAVRCPIQGGKISFNSTHNGIVFLDDGDRNIFLWNPSTGKILSIHSPVDLSFEGHCGEEWSCYKSFCIDPFTKKYQIVILLLEQVKEDHFTVDGILYSSVEKDWSVIPKQEIEWHWFLSCARNNLLVNGVAYWPDELLESVLSFDFSQKTIEFIKLPTQDLITGEALQLIQWKGAVSVLCYFAAKSGDIFEIRTRMEGSWTSMFRFKIQDSPETPLTLLAMAGTDERFWVLYITYNDMMRKQSEQLELRGRWMFHHDLYVYESGVGCTRLTSGDKNPIAHDFVESLLFPEI